MATSRKHGLSFSVCAILILITANWGAADDGTCTNPTSRSERDHGSQANFRDNPAGRSAWFFNGRKPSTTGLAGANQAPPARKLLQSIQQVNQLRGRPGLAEAAPSWQPLGPAPQISMYWGNVSGRVTSLAVDRRNQANALFVGTAFGGLWKTDDYTAAQPHFEPLGDPLWPSLAVGSIALDTTRPPNQPAVIYVGTGEANDSLDSYYGIGILKSSDGGKSWSLSTGAGNLVPLSSTVAFNLDGPFVGAAISKIVVDPANSQHVLAAVSSSFLGSGKTPATAIFESSNGGDSWKPIQLDDGTTSYNTSDLIYEPVQKAFYSAIPGRGVYRLDPGAVSWKALASPFGAIPTDDRNFSRASLAVRTNRGQSTIYMIMSAGFLGNNDPGNYNLSRPNGYGTGIVRSNDGGATWTPVPAPAQVFGTLRFQGFYDQWIVAPDGTKALLVGGVDIWRADFANSDTWTNVTRAYENGGGTLGPNQRIHPDQHAVVYLDDKNWIAGNDGGVWRTADGGNSWIDLNTDIGTIQFMSVTPMRNLPQAFLGGSQDNGTAVTGKVAGQWETRLTGDGGFTSDNPHVATQYFTERFDVSLCRSNDSGTSWSTVVDEDTIKDLPPFYVPYKLLASDQPEIVLGMYRVWLGPAVPTSPGVGWRPISPPLAQQGYVQAITSAPSSPATVYIGTSDGLLFKNANVHGPNAEFSWPSIKRNNLPNDRPYSALAVDPRHPAVVYLAVQGFGAGHVFRTDNGGGKWNDVTPNVRIAGKNVPIDTPANSILIDPDLPFVYLATDVGVFVSTDKGATWQPYGVGLPRTAILELKMGADRKIVAATHGRGAWTIPALSRAANHR